MIRLPVSNVRDNFADTLNRVAYRRERIVLHRRGKDLAALVPIEDLDLIAKLEDAIDVREARNVLTKMKRKGERPVPYEKARRGLDPK